MTNPTDQACRHGFHECKTCDVLERLAQAIASKALSIGFGRVLVCRQTDLYQRILAKQTQAPGEPR